MFNRHGHMTPPFIKAVVFLLDDSLVWDEKRKRWVGVNNSSTAFRDATVQALLEYGYADIKQGVVSISPHGRRWYNTMKKIVELARR